ncbi:MAG: hypothetical protein AB7F43_07765 [Bacteriovoracia bacterium]
MTERDRKAVVFETSPEAVASATDEGLADGTHTQTPSTVEASSEMAECEPKRSEGSSVSPCSLAPLVDRFSITIYDEPWHKVTTADRIRQGFEYCDLRVVGTFHSPRRPRSFRRVAMLERKGKFVRASISFDGNGIEMLSEEYEPKVSKRRSALNGKKNIFQDVMLYRRSEEFLSEQVARMVEEGVDAGDLFQRAYQSQGLYPPARLFTFVYALEFAWHVVLSPTLVPDLMAQYVAITRRTYAFPSIGTNIEENARINFSINPGQPGEFRGHVYLKEANLIRLEASFSPTFFKNNEEWKAKFGAGLPSTEAFQYLKEIAFKAMEPLLRPKPLKGEELPEMTALMKIQRIARAQTNAIVTRLRQGDGRIKVLSAESPIYRKCRDLFHAGILENPVRSQFRLLPEYRSILKGNLLDSTGK